MLPWLRRPVPPRHWRKVVAAIQGIVLTVAAADVLPGRGRPRWRSSSRWPCWPSRSAATCGGCGGNATIAELPEVADRWPGTRVVVGRMATVGACLTVWFVLVVPERGQPD